MINPLLATFAQNRVIADYLRTIQCNAIHLIWNYQT